MKINLQGFFKGLKGFMIFSKTWVLWVFCWVVNITGWLLIGLLWTQELFSLTNIQTTLKAFGGILGWTLFILLIFYLWTKYRNNRQKEKETRQFKYEAHTPINWKEILISKEGSKPKVTEEK
ncbi:hypothetical protein [Natranaerobius trueperi]|uniref:Uncharacterized protein n=1 Tax=Natranaerobius trueperi TaxID=759412 RepID=A0A226BVU8_9FIRM|nr:hypothetical protein [Natranaerobius trueperi]OWZ83168.1 hypothetical protein CDO51_10075 [Natranaerobius trueperi]